MDMEKEVKQREAMYMGMDLQWERGYLKAYIVDKGVVFWPPD